MRILIGTKSGFHLQESDSRMESPHDICLFWFQGITSYFRIRLRAFLAFNFTAVNKFTVTLKSLVTLYFLNSQVTAIT